MGQKLEFEWHVAVDTTGKFANVLCRLVGTEYIREWGPMPVAVKDSFIRAKRDALHRSITTNLDAVRIFGNPNHILWRRPQ